MSTSSANPGPNPTPPSDPSAISSGAAPAPRSRGRGRKWLIRAGICLGVAAAVGAVGLGGAEYYTSRPKFCGSCHIMDPYYESWSRDIHGAKIGALCVDCHYAPGERFTIKAKFKGLSQVTSYFSGRYGAGRPRAHVADDSCLRSGCHGDHAFASKILPIGETRMETRQVGDRTIEVPRHPSVRFTHERHLEVAKSKTEVEKQLTDITDRLRSDVGEERFKRIAALTTSVGPAHGREATLRDLVAELTLSDSQAKDALDLMTLEHRRIRIDQLNGLNCTACHTFNASLTSHVAADRQVCFTCHFANEQFNRNTGECLKCHEPPRRSVSIHKSTSQDSQSVVMDHDDIVKRGVDCASCHMDVLRGEARVAERDCTHCHDQGRFLVEFATRTTEVVRKYHEVHVANQRAHCFDCHRAIQHGLLDPSAALTQSGGFLEPVLNDCQHCHPNHHSEQVALLTGTGGANVLHPTPNAMMGSRLNCRACHTQSAESGKGDEVIRATREGCAACHSNEYMQMFDSWKHEIEQYLAEVMETRARVAKRMEERRAARTELPDRLSELLTAADQDIRLVRSGGGMHNRAYALQLLDAARDQLREAESLLTPAQ